MFKCGSGMFSFFLSGYCTRSCLTAMAGVGVAHKLLKRKNKKKITIQIFDKATSVKTIYKQSQGQAYQAISLSNPRSLYFGLTHQLSPQFFFFFFFFYLALAKNSEEDH